MNNISRFLIFLLSIFLLLSTSYAENTVKPVDAVIVPVSSELSATAPASGLCVFDSKLYTITDDFRLVSVASPEMEHNAVPETVINLLEYVDSGVFEKPAMFTVFSFMLAEDGTHLYLLDSFRDRLYRANGNELEFVAKLNTVDIISANGGAVKFRNPFILDGFLYMVRVGDVCQLYRFSLTDGTGELVDTGASAYAEIIPYKDGQLLARVINSGTIVILNAENPSVAQPFASIGARDTAGLAYDAVNDKVYCVSGLDLYQITEQSAEWVCHFGMDPLSFEGSLIWLEHYVALDWYGLFLDETAPADPLLECSNL